MDEYTSTINPGDVVMIVRWPHEHVAQRCAPGMVSVVRAVQNLTTCPACGCIWNERAARLDYGGAIPVSWLRKLGESAELNARRRTSFIGSGSGLVGSER